MTKSRKSYLTVMLQGIRTWIAYQKCLVDKPVSLVDRVKSSGSLNQFVMYKNSQNSEISEIKNKSLKIKFLWIFASYRVQGKYITLDSVYFLFFLGLCPSDQSREKWRQFWEFDNAWLVIQRDAFDLTHLPLFRPSFLSKQTIFFWFPNLTLNKKSDEKILFLNG